MIWSFLEELNLCQSEFTLPKYLLAWEIWGGHSSHLASIILLFNVYVLQTSLCLYCWDIVYIFSKGAPRAAASESPENSLETQTLWFYLRSTESEVLGWGLAITGCFVFLRDSGWFWSLIKLKNHQFKGPYHSRCWWRCYTFGYVILICLWTQKTNLGVQSRKLDWQLWSWKLTAEKPNQRTGF